MPGIRILWISLITLGVVVSVSAKKQADKEEAGDVPPTMNVQVNEAAVRLSPSFLGELAATLSYGVGVGVLEEREGWRRVEAEEPAVTGWMHVSALTEKTIKLEAGETDANVQASKEELTAGGRGFNQEIEDKFREKNEELEPAYKLLDRLVADPAGQVSRTEMIRFMQEGGLEDKPGGGQ